MTSDPADQPHGMTLIEVLLTLSILTFSVLALAGLYHHAYTMNSLARQRGMAVNMAHELMSRLHISLRTGHWCTACPEHETLGPPGSGSMVELDGLTTTYKRIWSVSLHGGGRLASIEVAVSWHDDQQNLNTIRLSSAAPLSPP